MVRARALAGFGTALQELGGDPESTLRASGIHSSMLHNPEGWIPFSTMLDAYNNASRHTGCPYFGMYFAASRDLSYLGPVILIFKYSENLKTGLENAARYIGIQNTGFEVSLQPDGHSVAFRFNMSPQLRAKANQWVEESLVTTLSLLRLFLGPSFVPLSVRLAHPPENGARQYLRYLGTVPEFDVGDDAVILDPAVLMVTNPRSDQDTVDFLRSYLEARIAERGSTDIATTVRSLLADLIPTGNYSIDVVADQLNIHRRTLQRRLSEAGVRYADILDDCRSSMAMEYLEDSNLPIVNLAHMLGYSDQSAFNHAFRRWHGVSPSAWLQDNRQVNNSSER